MQLSVSDTGNGRRPSEAEAFIDIRGVSQVFSSKSGGEVRALQDVDLQIADGEFISVLGPSGCGKSTLMRILGGLATATGGEVRIDGRVSDGPSPLVGMVFQQPALFPWRTVLDNVVLPAEVLKLPRKPARQRALELLEIVGLGHAAGLYPYELSGGMQQRVSIARALLHDPKILLMDEPFGALDAQTRENMGLELLRVWEATGKTVVFVTHSVNEALFLADRVVVMAARPGRIAEIHDVDLPRPRDLSVMATTGFNEAADHLRRLLGAKTGD
ncbi:ABC transporter ATP-binding protein [Nocardioides sp. Kera G14]|uniref:ABC transporter ATP-binding protein n=1 Tax=Nocardioides sp. Kera G14 TaxID=2884264 RepID=UPI001D114087|nr:ABC transporter ATP-binding protein [Nocardioides sp. Kera G14]UDY23485.1 ABC transporter ATP-binding protein [Nocardioides sp. Kera G14]